MLPEAEPTPALTRSALLSNIQIPLPEKTFTSSSVRCQILPFPFTLAKVGFLQMEVKKLSTQVRSHPLYKDF